MRVSLHERECVVHAYVRRRPHKVSGIVSAGIGTPTSSQHGPGSALYPEMHLEPAAGGSLGDEHPRVASDLHGLRPCTLVAPTASSLSVSCSLCTASGVHTNMQHTKTPIYQPTHGLTPCLRTLADRTARGVRGGRARERGAASPPARTPCLVSQLFRVRLR